MSNIPLLYSHESQEVFTEVFTARDARARASGRPRSSVRGTSSRRSACSDGPDGRRLRPEHGRDRRGPGQGARHHARGAGRVRPPLAPARHAGPGEARRGDRAGAHSRRSSRAWPRRTTACARTRRSRRWAKLRPYFDRKFGTVTAGNSSQITDGGAATLVMSASAARARGYQPLGTHPRVRVLRSRAGAHGPRARRGDAPRPEARRPRRGRTSASSRSTRLSRRRSWRARASSPRRPGTRSTARTGPIGEIDWEKTNVNGGAIALGHPVGSSANRLVTTLLKEMKRRGTQFGLATMCIGGGQGGRWSVARELSM